MSTKLLLSLTLIFFHSLCQAQYSYDAIANAKEKEPQKQTLPGLSKESGAAMARLVEATNRTYEAYEREKNRQAQDERIARESRNSGQVDYSSQSQNVSGYTTTEVGFGGRKRLSFNGKSFATLEYYSGYAWKVACDKRRSGSMDSKYDSMNDAQKAAIYHCEH